MIRFIIRGLVAALGFWVASKLPWGPHIEGLAPLIVAGLLLGVVNAIVRPIVTLLTLPITIITLGLFLFVVNALMLYVVSWLVHAFIHGGLFHIGSITHAIFTVIIIWIVSLAATMVLGGDEPARR
ncbi:MAG TPA: phage holin family protein [Caulobacteraceae bacterium]|nr:phage holin family protein [Caulobacteraceae bacterium]